MDSYVIELPVTLLSENLNVKMSNMQYDFNQSMNANRVVFDFKNCKYLSPTGMIYIAMWKDLLNENCIATFLRKPSNNVFRFIRAFSLVNDESDEYKFFEKFMIKMHRCMSVSECRNVQKEIMTKVIDKEELSLETYCAIDYMLNELWDNSGVHGYQCYETEEYPKPIYIGAYSYLNRVEICIADRGQGIYNSLKNNKKYTTLKKKDAILEATKNGVSGHPNGSPGFGLFCTSEFLKQGKGCLNIWSSGYQLQVTNTRTVIKKCLFEIGTLISIIIYKTAKIPFSKILSSPVYGERDADEYFNEVINGVFI